MKELAHGLVLKQRHNWQGNSQMASVTISRRKVFRLVTLELMITRLTFLGCLALFDEWGWSTWIVWFHCCRHTILRGEEVGALGRLLNLDESELKYWYKPDILTTATEQTSSVKSFFHIYWYLNARFTLLSHCLANRSCWHLVGLQSWENKTRERLLAGSKNSVSFTVIICKT